MWKNFAALKHFYAALMAQNFFDIVMITLTILPFCFIVYSPVYRYNVKRFIHAMVWVIDVNFILFVNVLQLKFVIKFYVKY